jgi:hypothetical protein
MVLLLLTLVVNPNLINQPAVGVTDTYVVTMNNVAGGTTLATVVVSHGSVKIDSIVMSSGIITPAPISTLVSGGLTWTKNNSTVAGGYSYWTTANNTCTALTQDGFTWRLPTSAELLALHDSGTSPLTTAGWTLDGTWSSSDRSPGHSNGFYTVVNLEYGYTEPGGNPYMHYASCVH